MNLIANTLGPAGGWPGSCTGGWQAWVGIYFVFPPSIPSSSSRVGLLSASAAGEATTQVAAGGWCTFPQLSGLAWGEEKINL